MGAHAPLYYRRCSTGWSVFCQLTGAAPTWPLEFAGRLDLAVSSQCSHRSLARGALHPGALWMRASAEWRATAERRAPPRHSRRRSPRCPDRTAMPNLAAYGITVPTMVLITSFATATASSVAVLALVGVFSTTYRRYRRSAVGVGLAFRSCGIAMRWGDLLTGRRGGDGRVGHVAAVLERQAAGRHHRRTRFSHLSQQEAWAVRRCSNLAISKLPVGTRSL